MAPIPIYGVILNETCIEWHSAIREFAFGELFRYDVQNDKIPGRK